MLLNLDRSGLENATVSALPWQNAIAAGRLMGTLGPEAGLLLQCTPSSLRPLQQLDVFTFWNIHLKRYNQLNSLRHST